MRFAFAKGKSIIADEMGLGKTIQAIATAELLRKERLATSILILCPTSLKYQWKREIERFKTSMFEGVLDGGEDAVFVGNSSKFKEMMDNLAEVMDESKQTEAEETPAVTTDQEEARAPVEQPQTSKENDNGNDNINDYATEK